MALGGAQKCNHRQAPSVSPLRPGVPSGAQESLPDAQDQLDCETHYIRSALVRGTSKTYPVCFAEDFAPIQRGFRAGAFFLRRRCRRF